MKFENACDTKNILFLLFNKQKSSGKYKKNYSDTIQMFAQIKLPAILKHDISDQLAGTTFRAQCDSKCTTFNFS